MVASNATGTGIPCIGNLVVEQDGDRTNSRGWAEPVDDTTRLAQLEKLR